MIETYVISRKQNFESNDAEAAYALLATRALQARLDTTRIQRAFTKLRQNQVSLYGKSTMYYDYYDTNVYSDGVASGSTLLLHELGIASTGVRHEQQSIAVNVPPANKLQQLGANTGLILLCYYAVMLITRPLARHSFIMRALKRFYFVRSSDRSDLMTQSNWMVETEHYYLFCHAT